MLSKRPAGRVFGQLLTEEREEIKKSLSADHKITYVIKKVVRGGRHGDLSYKFKHSQHDDDAIEIARPTRELNAIVFSAGTFSNRNEVKDTSLYVVERIDIVVGLMPKGDMGQSSDEREDLRHERDRMKHVRCRDV